MKTIPCLCIAIFLALLGTHARAQSTYSLYDDFAPTTIDPDKWVGDEYSTSRAQILECVRNIQSGGMHMLNRFYGDTSSDGGLSFGSNRLYFLNAPDIKGMKGTIQIKAYALSGCSSNPTRAEVRAKLGGRFFNTGTRTEGSHAGDVSPNIYVRRLSDTSDKANVFEVRADVYRCNDPNCNTLTSLGSLEADVFGRISKGKKVTLQVEWDQANHRFIFRRDTKPEVYIYYKESSNWNTSWNDVSEPGASTFKLLEIRGDIPSCTTDPRPMGFIEATFDDIYVK